ncbi:thioesterase family protein [Marinoscillum sp. MHG1-6]|uniref:acyl-CoA thioesterase n=1 Tax=Marinoscillum sp. MHG1-6 TaxID=2959627 RepID=UPI0021584543|nr:thioesterase family protein [Marinoscillum sp. MHG1-6]
MYHHDTQIRVRYAETDQMGYVYYGNYATYFEVARVEAFRHLGYPYKKMEEEGVGMPVLEYQIKYLQPAKYDDLLTIKLAIPEMPKARIRFTYEVTNQHGALINTGETTLVFMNMETGKATRIPAEVNKLLKTYFD